MSSRENLINMMPIHDITEAAKRLRNTWETAGLPVPPKSGSTIVIPVNGGHIAVDSLSHRCRITFHCFPYQNVILERAFEEGQWFIAQGTDGALDNAAKMAGIFYFDPVTLYLYVHHAMLRCAMLPGDEFTLSGLNDSTEKSIVHSL